jgi:hypothetical protein
MYFLLSGEGPTDMGTSVSGADICEGEKFLPGPMAVIVDQIVEDQYRYSPRECVQSGMVSRHYIEQIEKQLKSERQWRFPGKKRGKEIHYYFNNARVLARIAKQKISSIDDEIIAVLFRDADKASHGRGYLEEKFKSMLDGFTEEGFCKGVPMIPKPTSEAWLLCALKDNPYQNCNALEDRSSTPNSPNNLKRELEQQLGDQPQRENLSDLVQKRTIDYSKINMTSFNAFKNRLIEVLLLTSIRPSPS